MGSNGSMTNSLPPAPRDVVRTLPAYRTSPELDMPIRFRVSSNEAPFGPSPAVLDALADAATRSHRYPAPYGRGLIEAIAAARGIAPDRIAADSGSLSLLNHILLAYVGPGERVVYAWRSFEAYPISVASVGGVPVEVPNLSSGAHDLDTMATEARSGAAVVVLCTPNNPTGAAITQDELREFLERVPAETLVVLDEAYVDFVDEHAFDSLPLLDSHANLLVLRTFSKCYALAGVRAGYCLAHPAVIADIQRVMPAFPLSETAVAAASAAIRDTAHHQRVVDAVLSERRAVTMLLRRLGYPVLDSQANFVWLPLGDGTAAFAELCARHGVLVRPFAGEGVRITVGEPGLSTALAEFLPQYAVAA
jgi:histidinol-phosphate aminotransferase